MQELNEEKLTKELIEKLNEEITFVEPVNLSNYDTITIDDDTIELFHEEYEKTPVTDKKGEIMDYDYSNKSYTRIFKRNNMTGVYIEC